MAPALQAVLYIYIYISYHIYISYIYIYIYIYTYIHIYIYIYIQRASKKIRAIKVERNFQAEADDECLHTACECRIVQVVHTILKHMERAIKVIYCKLLWFTVHCINSFPLSSRSVGR